MEKSFILDVLCPLITESDNISSQLLNTILINIVEPHKSSKMNSYHLAKELIIKRNESFKKSIQQVIEHININACIWDQIGLISK